MCKNRRILIAEDEALIALDILTNLSRYGFSDIDTAYSPLETFDKCIKNPPDLVLMDINLGDGPDGIDLVKKIRESGILSSIIYMTSYSNQKIKSRAMETGFVAYILKPYTDKDLISSVKKAFAVL